eukprot:14845298-Heterocapsa_arctica.AAC.1
MTRIEDKVHKVLEGDFVTKGESLDEQWKHWNESSENYLGMVENKHGSYHKGRGAEISFVKTLLLLHRTIVKALPSLKK